MIVVIDDERTFKALPDQSYIEYDQETIQKNAERQMHQKVITTETEAAAFLWGLIDSYEEVKELWLDHDLGRGGSVSPLVKTLRVLAEQGVLLPIRHIYVHTANSVQGPKMNDDLVRFYNTKRVQAEAFGLRP